MAKSVIAIKNRTARNAKKSRNGSPPRLCDTNEWNGDQSINSISRPQQSGIGSPALTLTYLLQVLQ